MDIQISNYAFPQLHLYIEMTIECELHVDADVVDVQISVILDVWNDQPSIGRATSSTFFLAESLKSNAAISQVVESV